MSSPQLPEIWIEDCQETRPVDVALLTKLAPVALELVLGRTGQGTGAAGFGVEMEALEVSLVSEEEIARIHGEFFDDPTPTDVITFAHGELVIGVEAAAAEAEVRDWPLERELLLYLIHGFLHLQGLDDQLPEQFEEMRRLQEEILDLTWPLERKSG
jgi:probable rRNA maturation factor